MIALFFFFPNCWVTFYCLEARQFSKAFTCWMASWLRQCFGFCEWSSSTSVCRFCCGPQFSAVCALSCVQLIVARGGSLLGSSARGIFQARILEWAGISYSRGIFLTQGSNPRLLHLQHWQADSLPLAPPGKPGVQLLWVKTKEQNFPRILS